MTRSKLKRQLVRPIEQVSIMDKRFGRIGTASKRITLRTILPAMVVADLRKGSLASLTRYLAQEGGIPDRAVAIELRKLISSSVHRSRYRLLVIEHPDRPKSQGGRPRRVTDENTLQRYLSMFAFYEQALPLVGGKAYLAREEVAAKFGCDVTTVKRAIRSAQRERQKVLERAQADEADRKAAAEMIERRRVALANLRDGAKSSSS